MFSDISLPLMKAVFFCYHKIISKDFMEGINQYIRVCFTCWEYKINPEYADFLYSICKQKLTAQNI